MAKLDPFSAQIVKLVRNMPADAILELVRNQLGVLPGAAATVSVSAPAPKPVRRKKRVKRVKAKRVTVKRAAKKAGAKKAVAKKAKGRPKRKAVRGVKRSTVARQKLLGAVEKAVKSSKGLSASEIAKKTKIPQTRVAAAVRELKLGKRIFQGGDRRFARYASDARTAQQASLNARTHAAGPKRGRKRGRK
jgi:ribosomal protein S25